MATHPSYAPRPRLRRRAKVLLGTALCTALIGTAIACGDDEEDSAAFPAGTPSEVSDSAGAFPAPNGNYANTREVDGGAINAENISTLEEAWTMDLGGTSAFGVFSSNPVVTDDTVYLQDINSNVFAVDRTTGEPKWERAFDAPTTGPNGVAVGEGFVVGGTATSAFALDAETGEVAWEKEIVRQPSEGVDMAPLIWDGKVIISSVPGASLANFYGGGGRGIVYALDLETGEEVWQFDTTSDELWGNAEVNSGGGLWQTPAIGTDGNIYMAVANPGPWPGTPEFPNGSSRPGPNLYTNSLVVLDGETGELQWHWQALAHDLRDWDLHLGPILTTAEIDGESRDVVVLSGKLGTVYVLDRESRELIWEKDVGLHTPESGIGTTGGEGRPDQDGPNRNAPFREFPVTVYPGWLGGVETAMAVSDGVVYVPVNNLCSIYRRQGNFTEGSELCDLAQGTGELVALDLATGEEIWKKDLPQQNYGGATVVNDVVVTGTFDGMMHAFNKADGTEVWTKQLPAQSNSTPAITGDMIIQGAGFAAAPGQKAQVVAYRLPES